MKLKFHTGARSRIALAVVLAASSCAALAQTTPGGVAAAQSQSSERASPGRLPPPTSGPRAPRPGIPGGASPGMATSPSMPGSQAPAAMQADGRLKPLIIRPAEEALRSDPTGGYGSGPSGYPSGPTGALPVTGVTPGMAPAGPHNPFAPAAAQPAAQLPVPVAPSPKAKKAAAAENAAKEVDEAPYINMQCTTPEIKTQGTFVGKIQNRYVYKYKSQYCFDVQP